MLYVISYDVSEDDRRRRIAEALKDFGRRVQYSVFECEVDAEGMKDLLERIEFELDFRTDSCRCYRLCQTCTPEVRILGKGDRYSDPGFVIV